jgi:uncharacterized protein DUF1214
MFDNKPTETQYFYTDSDSSGAPLEGAKSYAITFAAGQEPPVNGSWSMTLYNEHHFFHPNDLKRYSLGTRATGCLRRTECSHSTSAPTGASRASSTGRGSRHALRPFRRALRFTTQTGWIGHAMNGSGRSMCPIGRRDWRTAPGRPVGRFDPERWT